MFKKRESPEVSPGTVQETHTISTVLIACAVSNRPHAHTKLQ